MDPVEREAWRDADRALNALLDLPVDARASALASMALPPPVHARVVRLLAALDAGSGPLDHHPAADVHAALRAPDALAGRRLGRWRLEGELGRGGMSVVYRAQAVEGAAGQVAAVKVLTLGALAHGGHERFVREQQALLRLRHPYIATLYDAGVAEDGTAWLAMALVEGERIDAWCDARGCDLDARVALVRQVCEALAYAHRSLVIHRDIKPSNVLVDADGHVRLLDFGIARLIDAAAPEATATAHRALTPDYAAPEHCAGAPPGTTMDVYGAGALLHRLLTGAPPQRTRRARDTEPVLPSRIARQAPTAPAWASRLRGDLDTVLMKALAATPEARYPSVEALSDDLARWQQRRPVRAHAPSLRYRLGKALVRHRVGVGFGIALALVVLAGTAGTLWQAREARLREDEARRQAAISREQRDRAAAEARRAEAVRDLLADIFVSAEPTNRREIPDALDLLHAGSERARTVLADDPQVAADVLVLSGSARGALNDLDGGQRDLEQALRLLDRVRPAPARALSRAHWELGIVFKMRGDHERSLSHYATALRWSRAPGVPEAERVAREVSHAAAQAKLGRTEEAIAALRAVVASLPRRGVADTQEHLDALNALSMALALARAPVESRIPLHQQRAVVARAVHGADSGWYAYTLADALPTLRKSPAHLDAAESMGREAVAIVDRVYAAPHMFTSVAHCNLGALLLQRGRAADALGHFDRSVAVDEALGRNDLHAESCRFGRADARLRGGDAVGALADLAVDRRMLDRLGKRGDALWLRACGTEAAALQALGRWPDAARVLAACEASPGALDDDRAAAYHAAAQRQRAGAVAAR